MLTNEVIVNGQTLISLRADTVAPEYVREGITFHDRTGATQTGTYVPPSNGPILLVTVTGHAADSVTATKGGTTVALTYNSSVGKWWGELTGTGTWTVRATAGSSTTSTTVAATAVTVYEVQVSLTRLPAGYTELEYIQSSGTQYIETEIANSYGFYIETKVTILDSGTALFVGTHNDTQPFERNQIGTVNLQWRLNVGNDWPSYGEVAVDGTYEVVGSTITGNSFLIVDGEKVLSSEDSSARANRSITLFSSHYTRSIACVPVRMYFVKLFSDIGTNMQRNFIPAKRTSDNAIGMYDLANNKWYGNAGTGAFIAGPEV